MSGLQTILARLSFIVAAAMTFGAALPAYPAGMGPPSEPQAEDSKEQSSLFRAKNAVRGYAEFEFNPAHNERDLGRCAGTTDNVNAPCAAFTRYAIGGYLEFQPFGRRLGRLPLHRLFVFVEPRSYLGRNLPGLRYSASMDPILYEQNLGLGVELRENLEFRWWLHQGRWLGHYGGNLGAADQGSKLPYGRYSAFALRWSYGGWGRHGPARSEGTASNGARLVFPKRFLRGYAEGEVSPSHYERDLGRCLAIDGQPQPADSECAAYSRYAAGGYVEFQPFGRKLGPVPVHRLFFFVGPRVYFGRNVPESRYSASLEPIVLERELGVGLALTRRVDLRSWLHRNYWFGRYRGSLGPLDMGPNGPYGLYAAVSLRWYFGGYGR